MFPISKMIGFTVINNWQAYAIHETQIHKTNTNDTNTWFNQNEVTYYEFIHKYAEKRERFRNI